MKPNFTRLFTCLLLAFITANVNAQFSASYDQTKAGAITEISISGQEADDDPFTIDKLPDNLNKDIKLFNFDDKTKKETQLTDLTPTSDVPNQQLLLENFGTYYKKNASLILRIKSGSTVIGTYSFKTKANIPKPAITGKADDADEEEMVKTHCANNGIRFIPKLNQWRKGNELHVFLNVDGSYILSSIPTTATEDLVYFFHMVHQEGDNLKYKIESAGAYAPKNTVYGSEGNTQVAGANSSGKAKIKISNFEAIGPFTDFFTVTIKNRETSEVLIEKRVTVAEVHHISLNAGLFSTFVRDPRNITPYTLPSGDMTLAADDPKSRGMVTIMLTFYPKPRNLLFPINNWKERVGFVVGTGISKKLAENFFSGLSYDLARGIALSAGAHYGRVSYIADQPDFKFGEDKFTGSLDNRVKFRWDLNFYAGITLDFRLLGLIFNSTTGGMGK